MLERELRELDARRGRRRPTSPRRSRRGWTGHRLPPRAAGCGRLGAPAWAVAVAVVAVLVGGVMAVPPARSAVLEWLGIASVRIERAEPPRYGSDLLLGRALTLEAARRDAGFPVGRAGGARRAGRRVRRRTLPPASTSSTAARTCSSRSSGPRPSR